MRPGIGTESERFFKSSVWSGLVIVIVTMVMLTRAQTVQDLSIQEAIRIGRDNSKPLRIAESKVDAAQARSSEARTALLPSLKLEGGYKRQSDIDPFALSLPILPAPIVISPNIPNVYNLRVGLQQPLFTGFKLLSNARTADRLAEATEADLKGSESDLVMNITSAYWTLYQTIEARRYVNDNIDRLTSYLSDTQNLLKAGMATRNDLLKIQVQLSNAKLSQIDAANDVDVAMMNLNNIMGQSVDTPIRLTSQPADTVGRDSVELMAGEPVPSLVDMAMSNRPDLQGMNYRLEASRATARAAQGGWWPQIGLMANYFYSRPNQRYLPLQDEFRGTWEVGVTLQFDVWNWGTTLFQTQQANSQVHQNEFLLAQMKDNASLEVKKSRLGVHRAAKRIDVARDAIEQAEENARSTNEKYKNGLATSTDLLDASLAVLQARTNYTGALVEHEIALARLNKAVGR